MIKPKQKTTPRISTKRIVAAQPLTETQNLVFDSYKKNRNLLLMGTPRTGKTFLMMYLALNEIAENYQNRSLVIFRSAVSSRDVGFLPGSLDEKIALFQIPYIDICTSLYASSIAYKSLVEEGVIQFAITSYLRGTTISDAIVLIDECQNFSFGELHTVITRLGRNTKLLMCGDFGQTDLPLAKSGFRRAYEAVKKMPSFDIIEFTPNDIVGSPIIKEWILANEEEQVCDQNHGRELENMPMLQPKRLLTE